MKRILAGFGVLLISLSSTTAADVGDIAGGWVAEGVACSALEDYSDERLMKIDEEFIEFYESSCVIADVNRADSTYRFQLLCEAEGETARVDFEATLTSSDRLRVTGGLEYVRCE